MPHDTVTALIRSFGPPCLRFYGRASYERDWNEIDLYAASRRDVPGGWPLIRGTAITWSANVVAAGWEFAAAIVREQAAEPATRDRPLMVRSGRLFRGRTHCDGPSAREVLAHECGHTGQARRMSFAFWPVGAAFTLFREGERWPNWFENEASATGQFGGIIDGSIDRRLLG